MKEIEKIIKFTEEVLGESHILKILTLNCSALFSVVPGRQPAKLLVTASLVVLLHVKTFS